MSSAHNIVDYFIISGLNIVSGLEPDQLAGDNLHCPPLDRPFKSRVLAHYPDAVTGNPFDEDAVCMLCHPNGLRFQTQKDSREPYFHSFLITKEDGSRLHGAALTFFEQVDTRQICNAMQTLQDMHMAELSNVQSKTLNPHLGTSVYKQSPKAQRKLDPSTQDRTYNMRQDSLFVAKVIAVLSQVPLVATHEKCLRAILAGVEERDLPLESHVYNLIHEVPLPPPGNSLRLSMAGCDIVCQRPGVTEMPLLDFDLQEMFTLLGIDNVLNLFSCVLLEHQILMFSKDYQKLMLVAEGITALVFPFQWQHVYVPILPASLAHFLDAPVPFIMGLHRNTADCKKELQLDTHVNMCILDIDTRKVELPEDLPTFPQYKELHQDLQHELRRLSRPESAINGHQRDSGFIRESFIGPEDSGMSSAEGSTTSSLWSIPNKMELLQQNETMSKITALAKRTGVISSLDDISDSLSQELPRIQQGSRGPSVDPHTRVLIVNSSIREIFLHYFLQIFCSYESFVIHLNQDMESWLTNRESMQNFDRTAFLSDHPETHLPFLSAFIETQMFTSYIDNKVLAQWEDPDPNLYIFDIRLRTFKEDLGDQRIRRFYHSGAAKEAESSIEKRATVVDYYSTCPHALEGVSRQYRPGVFPILNHQVLNREPANKSKRSGGRWKREKVLSEHIQVTAEQRERLIQETRNKASIQPKLTDMNPAAMIHTNWKFVETLLKECKAKTKRMLVEKMGQEAVELGHGEATITAAEENTLIASLCDLLERIWSHGLQQKQGRSALWSLLVSFMEVEEAQQGNKPIDPNLLTPDLSSSTFEGDMSQACPSGMQTWPVRRHRRKPSRGLEMPVLNPLPSSVVVDIKNVLQMTEIKTDVGHARAFVRLSLEKKLLSKHLKELMSNADLLRSVYKRYAFLRCEDEREQFLYHMLSLNAVDYYCFTNTFNTTFIPYRILIFPRQNTSGSTSTANGYCTLSGQLGQTDKIPIPKHTLDISVKNKNLGILTTLSIGHDNAGMSPKWLVEHVLVRNEITGHTYRFPCGRWLGRGMDDGALERLLVAEMVPPSTDHQELMEKCRTPPRCRSPSMPRRSNEPKMDINRIREMCSDACNNLVKHFNKLEKERGSLTSLLCGEYGLVFCMEHVFQCGFKSSRLFRGRFFVWDFLEKVQNHYDNLLSDRETVQINQTMRRTMNSFNYVVTKINQASVSIGKDGRFQIFVCIGVRDRWLQHWIRAISKTPVTSQMYEEQSFLRDPTLVQFLIQILESLREFNFVLEASLIQGVEL